MTTLPYFWFFDYLKEARCKRSSRLSYLKNYNSEYILFHKTINYAAI